MLFYRHLYATSARNLRRQVTLWECTWNISTMLWVQCFSSQSKHKILEKTFWIDCDCLLTFTGNPVQLSHQELDDFLAVNTYKDQTVGRWMCGICGLSFLNKIDVNRHIESKHVILPELLCAICNKPSKTRHSLRIHMKITHPEAFAEK